MFRKYLLPLLAMLMGMRVLRPAVIVPGRAPKVGWRSMKGALMVVAVLAERALLAGLMSFWVLLGSRSATTK